MIFQSTPSPRRETVEDVAEPVEAAISIHSLPKEGDYFTPPLSSELYISIHSLPKEGDLDILSILSKLFNFNPLPPQGGRPILQNTYKGVNRFQSTPSPRRETVGITPDISVVSISIHSLPKEGDDTGKIPDKKPNISIHSLPKEGDFFILLLWFQYLYFNPLPPQGGRLQIRGGVQKTLNFNPLPPQGGRL